mgnify:CR=1 FL=1|tara:strand:- start:21248 stop:22270 length:1023 start_codon:yes stop_codon:yes gene_type:complete
MTLQKELIKILDYRNYDYEIINELDQIQHKILLKKYSVSIFFKIKRLIKKILYLFINFIFKKNLILVESRKLDTVEDKYEKIAGSYIEIYLNSEKKTYLCDFGYGKKVFKLKGNSKNYTTSYLSNILKKTNSKSFMEIGAGELTNFLDIYKKSGNNFRRMIALDLSFNRLFKGKKFLEDNKFKLDYYLCGNAEKIPLSDDSVDLSYSVHCLEQVPHLAEKIVKEMIRVSKNYIVLIEPSFQFGSIATKNKIFKKGYIRLSDIFFKKFNANIIYRNIDRLSSYTNSAEIIILEKANKKNNGDKFEFICPDCKNILELDKNKLFCKHDNSIYDKKNGIFIFN